VLQTLADRFAAALDQIDTDVLASSMAQALDINGDGKVSVFALLFDVCGFITLWFMLNSRCMVYVCMFYLSGVQCLLHGRSC
jgi:hypothetical protein